MLCIQFDDYIKADRKCLCELEQNMTAQAPSNTRISMDRLNIGLQPVFVVDRVYGLQCWKTWTL